MVTAFGGRLPNTRRRARFVPLHQLFEIACLEQKQPNEDQQPIIIDPSVGDSPDRATGQDHGEQESRHCSAHKGRPAAGQGGPAEHRSGDAVQAKVEPTWALPIGERAMTKNEATAARSPASMSALTRTQLVRTPLRLADRSS